MDKEYYNKTYKDVLEILDTNIDGLSNNEVLKRQKKYGKNVLNKKKKISILKILFMQLIDPIVLVLLVASVLSFISNEVVDGFGILFIILIDMIIGTIEEYKANKSAEALINMIKVNCNVIRNGKEISIDSSELVIGDIVLLESGNIISADMRIIECKNLTVNESCLTGESINSIKDNNKINKKTNIMDRSNMLYAGTSIVTGRCKAVVTEIGINTEIGKIQEKVNSIKEEKSPLTIRIEKFSKEITIFIIVIALIIMFVLKMKGFNNNEVILSVIALSVSAMPEGLPLALTMALTIASNKMLKKNVIIKKLNAVESLGSCTVIASDKTGTLTVNEQTAKKIVLPDDSIYEIDGSGYNDKGKIKPLGDYENDKIDELIKCTVLNNEATIEKKGKTFNCIGDSIDIAFKFLGLKNKTNTDKIKKLCEVPYESENKYSLVYFEENKKLYCTMKGSIEVILNHCDTMMKNNKEVKINKEKLISQNESLSKKGYRVIAVASTDVDKVEENKIPKMNFLGLVAFIDPIRKNVVKSINQCRESGIKVVMITGDHPLTAFSIAKELEIAEYYNDVINSDKLEEAYKKGEEYFDNIVRNKTVFTRVTPIQKLQIVESFKRQGEFVAVTGDGVNDAPAIKSANIGIAMGTSTDVAKETASMIILNDDFTSIVEGIKEGRIAYSNIRKICYFLISCGISEILFYILSVLFNMPIPLVAIQLLWVNIVTDGLQDLALSFEQGENNIMKEKPRNPKESLFDKTLISEVLFSGITIGLMVFGFWCYLLNGCKMDVSIARGYILTFMVFIQNIHVLNCRSEEKSAFEISVLKNPFVLFSILFSIVLHIIIMEVPVLSNLLQIKTISFEHILLIFSFSIIILITVEIYKIIHEHKRKNI